jgi:hypothetical protein
MVAPPRLRTRQSYAHDVGASKHLASPLRRKLNGMGRVQYLKNNALVRLVRVLNAIPKRVLLRWE